MPAALQLTGKRFGRLVVIECIGSKPNNGRQWLCQCDCGKTTIVPAGRLHSRTTRSCGCLSIETIRAMDIARNTKHGMHDHPLYHVWWMMICRCEYPSTASYPLYGGRGIKVCTRWRNDFSLFVHDMGERPSLNHSIDRINNDGDYCPENCRWATWKEQQRNKTSNRLITYRGETRVMAEWADILGLPYSLVQSRLIRGWSPERTFETPIMKQYSHPKKVLP